MTLVKSLLARIPSGPWRLALAILLAAIASGASVALMGTSAWLLSRAAEHPPVLYLQVAVVGVRAFGVFRGFFRYAERIIGHDLALRMQGALREVTYQALSRTTLLGRRRGDLLVRVIADVDAVMDIVVRVVVPFCSASLVIIGTTLVIALLSVTDAVVLFVTAVIAGVVMPVVSQRLSLRADQSTIPARGAMGAQMRELALTASDLVAYGVSDDSLRKFMTVDAQLRRAEEKAARARGWSSAGQMLSTGIAVAAALIIGGRAVVAGQMSAPSLAVLVLVPLALHEVFSDFAKAAQTMTKAATSLARVNEIINEPAIGSGDRQELTDDATTSGSGREGEVILDEVSLGWPHSDPIITGLSLRLRRGDSIAVTGTSGIGKTTLAATIMGLIPPKAGSIQVHGRVGYLAQDAHIFATSLAENVRIGRKDASDHEIAAALKKAGLLLDPHREVLELGSTLSGGEAQRVAMARVLVGDHDVWILDEPTEHLDQETATALMDDLWSVTRDAAVLVISHDPAVITACNSRIDLAAFVPDQRDSLD